MERDDYPSMIRNELQLRGIKPTTAIITALADAAEREDTDFGEVGVAALVVGFMVGRGIR